MPQASPCGAGKKPGPIHYNQQPNACLPLPRLRVLFCPGGSATQLQAMPSVWPRHRPPPRATVQVSCPGWGGGGRSGKLLPAVEKVLPFSFESGSACRVGPTCSVAVRSLDFSLYQSWPPVGPSTCCSPSPTSPPGLCPIGLSATQPTPRPRAAQAASLRLAVIQSAGKPGFQRSVAPQADALRSAAEIDLGRRTQPSPRAWSAVVTGPNAQRQPVADWPAAHCRP